jgi:hypothetical protein
MLENIRLACKRLTVTNALAYLFLMSYIIYDYKMFVKQAPVVNVLLDNSGLFLTISGHSGYRIRIHNILVYS